VISRLPALPLLAAAWTAMVPGPAWAASTPPARPPAAAAEAEPSPRALKAFEDAARSSAAAEGAAPDWPAQERRWRTVLAEGEVPEARFNLGVALAAQGRAGEARAEYERALIGKPSLRQAAVNLAVLEEARGDTAGAAASYARILREYPDDAMARERLATLYLGSGQYDQAWRLGREALLRDPRSVGSFKVLARVALARKDHDLARLVARRAEKLAPRDPELPTLAGEAFARQGDAAAAGAQFRRALALDPGHLPARYALLDQAVQAGTWSLVAEHAQAILEARPGDARVELARGVALRHLGKPDEALAAYDRAEKLAGPDLPEAKLARGVLYARVKSECEPAITELTAYLKAAGAVVPANSQASRLIRECEQQMEENRKAQEAARAMAEDAARKKAAPDAVPPPPPPPEGATPTKP
jgi:tetratricopeptide (TPR) repeat protein